MPEILANLSPKEMQMVERIAKRDGLTLEEAATKLASASLARRVRSKTGKGPARVYSMKGKR